MAILANPEANENGRYGNLVVYDLNGKKVIRTIGRNNCRATPARLSQRTKFSLVAKFLTPVRHIIAKSYVEAGSGKLAIGAASSYHMREALTGENPNFSIDFNKVIITKGNLRDIQSPQIQPQPNASLAVSWNDNSQQTFANANDKLLAMMYNETAAEWHIDTHTAIRSHASANFALPESWREATVHCWLAFYDELQKEYSTNIYVDNNIII